jgi:polyisoprenyl-teichoic acid--peptidoglycan teichoic acid transferase
VILASVSASSPFLPAREAVARADARTRLRRAVTLLAMTVAVPGSAQLVAGNRRIGRVAVRCWIALVMISVLTVGFALSARSRLIGLATSLWFLGIARVLLVVMAVAFAYLLIDAWRLSDPLRLSRPQRLFVTSLNGVLCFSVTGALLIASHYVAVQRAFIEHVFASHRVVGAHDGRFNVLLLGGDAGADRVGLRPDSITVASIDAETGRTVLFGLPRNLQNVPFPSGSAMHKQYPHGYNCDGCYLNGIYTWATEHRQLFPGVKDPGVLATTQAVEQITGLSMNYYVLIDMRGFRDLVDAVGGITIDVNERLPIGGVGGPVTGHIEPGRRHLDGYQTLWFARSRATSDDYSRMARQKCVMNAMLHQLRARTVLTHFSKIAKAGQKVISTSIPPSEISRFLDLAGRARRLPINSVSFVPPRINGYAPDYPQVRRMVESAIKRSENADEHKGKRKHPPRPSAERYAANDSGNLTKAC